MKIKLLVSLLAISCVALVWCTKNSEKVAEYPVAEQVCLDNWGEVTVDEEWVQICLLWWRWINLADMEENTGEVAEDEIDFVLPEGAKTSLTNEELDELAETNFPKWYGYTTYNLETQESTTGEYTYPEDLSHTLLIPSHATMASREVVSSWIEDGMIYTLTDVTLQDDTVISVLYIVDPVSLNFVAANVENGNEMTNYQFTY